MACLALNLSLFAVTQFLHLSTRGSTRANPPPRTPIEVHSKSDEIPFISIHVPSHDEPPEIVSETLRSLARLDYPRYEVILLDNNTPNESSWRPIETLCENLGPRFRFMRVSGLSGAKAGALNLCLKACDRRTGYIAIVDADYQVDANFLTLAIDQLRETKAAFVQFPQAFRNAVGASRAVALELEDYFSVLGRQAPEFQAPLLTGTLSVISKACLEAVGGWSHASVTEDAELGLRLFAAGYVGSFCDRTVGRGLLPMSMDGLRIQRRRWILGNTQTLFKALFTVSRRERARTASIFAQLTAWPTFWLAPILFLLLGIMLPSPNLIVEMASALGAFSILISVVIAIARGIANRRRELPVWQAVGGPLAVKLALVWTSSSAWFELLGARKIGFVKTPKVQSSAKSYRMGAAFFALACIVAMGVYAARDERFAAVACAFGALSWPAGIWVDAGLRRYAELQATCVSEAGLRLCTA